jgi:hypothetical protein
VEAARGEGEPSPDGFKTAEIVGGPLVEEGFIAEVGTIREEVAALNLREKRDGESKNESAAETHGEGHSQTVDEVDPHPEDQSEGKPGAEDVGEESHG